MNKIFFSTMFFAVHYFGNAQSSQSLKIPSVPNPAERLVNLKNQWDAFQNNPPQIDVRSCFIFPPVLVLPPLSTLMLRDSSCCGIKKRQSPVEERPFLAVTDLQITVKHFQLQRAEGLAVDVVSGIT